MVGSTGLMREDITFIFLCGVVGVAMPFPVLFRMKFRFTNRSLELFSDGGMIICILLTLALFNFTDVHVTLPLLCLLSFVCCYLKLMATFEIFSKIQLWMTPRRDFRIFFPLLYIGSVARVRGCPCRRSPEQHHQTVHEKGEVLHSS